MPREHNYRTRLLFKLDSSKKIEFNHITIQETVIITSIEAVEANIIDIDSTGS